MTIKPYVYIIKHNKSGVYYIGSRSANKLPASKDLWHKYYSSSKKITELRKQDGNAAFETVVISEYASPEEAYTAEQQLIKEHINDPLCVNLQHRHNSTAVFLTTGTSRTISEESRQKISKTLRAGAHRTYERSEEHLEILRSNGRKTGGWNKGKTYKAPKISEALKGRVSPRKGQLMPKYTCPHCSRVIGGANNLNKHIASSHPTS